MVVAWVTDSEKPFWIQCDGACLLTAAVNSFSHQTRNPLAWSPGPEGGGEEEVGCADYKEVSSRVRGCGRGRSWAWLGFWICADGESFWDVTLRNSALSSEHPDLMVIAT